ncbi:piggyBac transposable element-derived protein 4-like [Macrosteles quadrilineatus]|uniref:piggyBac transposable element-derived protein 4-like n=1 Tax=Macrosteles quadrilineatus TaxID=74068 RepID=UPI0023E2CAE0|nr:piggyBac transposable element-derived protein 4-like [Macrosteles quadrilineatus]
MPCERFEAISKNLHFCDDTKISDYQGQKGFFKIFSVIEHLNARFQSSYRLSQNISIDESLTLWKGRLGFKQYLPLKAAKFGIKSFDICESSSGFTWSFIVYTGKGMVFDNPIILPKSNMSTAIVLSLMEPLLDKGFTLLMDNWYNSPELSKLLKEKNTDTCGTLKLSRKNVPDEIKSQKLEKGEIVVKHSGDVMVMKWHDKRIVTLISTFHSHEMEQRLSKNGRQEMKPALVYEYNKQMGGVDMRDQMLHAYQLERKRGLKWYVKIFKRLLNISVLNSFIIWKSNTQKIDHISFRLDLIKMLFETHGPEVPRPVFGRPSIEPRPARLTERHFIYLIPPTGSKVNAQKRCCVCAKRGVRRDSRYWCPKCEAGLCLGACFEDYHTKVNF